MTSADVFVPLSEKNVEISEFLGSHPGFFGIIKQRYSDFLVNEIGSSGQELHLTDITNLPNPPVVEVSEETTEPPPNIGLPDGVTEEIQHKLKELASYIDSPKCAPERKGSVLVVVDALSKEQRRAIHQFVQHECQGLVSTTDEVDGQKVIRVSIGSAASLHREQKRRVPRQPKLFTRFLLYKENMDTMEAVSRLAGKLRLRAHDVGYAGTKDRRGKTVQLASISKIPPHRIADAARYVRGLRVGNFSFSPNGLALGQLGGNIFTIVLREVTGSDEDIAAAVSSVQSSGVLNYYGLQRFGTQPGHTHVVGKYLLQGEWAKAIETILKPRPGDRDDQVRSETLEAWRAGRITKDEATNKLYDSGCMRGGVEKHLLQGILQRGDTDKLGAINCIPRNWRTLYLHAYQAYLWNKLVSRRIKEHGTAVMPGDLVMVSSAGVTELEETAEEELTVEEEIDTTDASIEEEEEEEEKASEAGDTNTTSLAEEAQDKSCSKKGNAKLEKLHSCVRLVTAEEVDSIQLNQVIIPSIGYAVRLPGNHLADWYHEMLKEDDLTMANLDPKHKSFAVSGAYRPLLLKPKNLTHKIMYYTDPLKPLVISDLDRLNGMHEIVPEDDANDSSPKSNLAHDNGNCDPDKEVDNSNGTLVSETLVEQTNVSASDDVKQVAEEQDKSSQMEEGDSVEQSDSNANENMEQKEASPGVASTDVSSNKDEPAESEALSNGAEGNDTSLPAEEKKSEASSPVLPSAPKQLKAVVLSFSLPPAGYATMVLRELLKIDTGSQYHASLNSNQSFGDSKGERGRGFRGGHRGSGRGDWGRGGRGGFRGGDRGRGGRGRGGRGFHSSRGDKRSFSGQRSNRGGNKRPRY